MTRRPSISRTLVAGLGGGVAFLAGTFLTFAQLGGSREGETGLLFDPDTQHDKVIAVWKEIEPLPRVIEQPAVILAGMVVFGVAAAFVFRSVAPAWPGGVVPRAMRLGMIVWLGTVFAEFMGPFNTLHQPLYLSVLAWAFWAVPAFGEAFVIAAVLESRTAPAHTHDNDHDDHDDDDRAPDAEVEGRRGRGVSRSARPSGRSARAGA